MARFVFVGDNMVNTDHIVSIEPHKTFTMTNSIRQEFSAVAWAEVTCVNKRVYKTMTIGMDHLSREDAPRMAEDYYLMVMDEIERCVAHLDTIREIDFEV